MKRRFPIIIFLLLSIHTFGQHIIFGRLVDSKETPILGANILEIGTTNGTVSHDYGEFELTTEMPTGTLFFLIHESSFELKYELSNDSTLINVLLKNFNFGKNQACEGKFKKQSYIPVEQLGIVDKKEKKSRLDL